MKLNLAKIIILIFFVSCGQTKDIVDLKNAPKFLKLLTEEIEDKDLYKEYYSYHTKFININVTVDSTFKTEPKIIKQNYPNPSTPPTLLKNFILYIPKENELEINLIGTKERELCQFKISDYPKGLYLFKTNEYLKNCPSCETIYENNFNEEREFAKNILFKINGKIFQENITY